VKAGACARNEKSSKDESRKTSRETLICHMKKEKNHVRISCRGGTGAVDVMAWPYETYLLPTKRMDEVVRVYLLTGRKKRDIEPRAQERKDVGKKLDLPPHKASAREEVGRRS